MEGDDRVRLPGEGAPQRYRVQPHDAALRPEIDPHSLNGLTDALEDEAVLAKLGDAQLPTRPR